MSSKIDFDESTNLERSTSGATYSISHARHASPFPEKRTINGEDAELADEPQKSMVQDRDIRKKQVGSG